MAHLYVFWNEIWPWHIGLRWAIVALWATCLKAALPKDTTTKVGWPSRFPAVQLCSCSSCGFYPQEWSNFQEGLLTRKMPPMGNSPVQDCVLCDKIPWWHLIVVNIDCSKYQIIDGKQEICHNLATKAKRRKALFLWGMLSQRKVKVDDMRLLRCNASKKISS